MFFFFCIRVCKTKDLREKSSCNDVIDRADLQPDVQPHSPETPPSALEQFGADSPGRAGD